ncbi:MULTISPECIES: phage shock protein PspA [Pseudoalteromonas]|uniref:Phage shock protein PspA n=2 Tax=Pseudoalteromonas TaxID=53246 RepID=A0A0F4QYA1_9GAMM|nr:MULTISPECIES: phage shock protein PspA [Pseudoalteromonas]KJZ12319.1 phage-shock protein [Pseudoalteromonas rubra]MCF2907274.1 phage shock protein PspA [Pseudoalteromonas sp. DL2-H2.2]MCG7537806.1 phage shock protein PspA [Pseudoalteromonas sp. OOF1S-7]QTL33954.1 phage shock protein PspA [Pseudoalteromonas viridis]RZM71502.1 phage shock protein PspA [Pseudoalteromonas rubra]
MGIFSRFADIVNSNINAILDKAEDPEKMVRLIIQEMEDTLVEVRSTSAKTLAEKKELERRVEQLRTQAHDWQQKAELALTKDREDLARAALLEKQKATDAADSVTQELAHVESHIEKLQQEVTTLQEKLADAKARQKAIVLRQRSAESRLDVKKALDSSKVEDALNRFERYESKIDGLESQVESYDLGKKSLADEIADLQKNEKVDDELAALKKKLADK